MLAAYLRQGIASATGAVALAGIGGSIFYKKCITQAHAESTTATTGTTASKTTKEAAPRIFSSRPAFIALKLQSSVDVNHNTKLLRFVFPRDDAISGLGLTCELLAYVLFEKTS